MLILSNRKCKRLLMLNEKNKCIGRVATFVNPKYNPKMPVGGIGFFEIIEDREAAFFLLDHCKEWLINEGVEEKYGLINFGESDYWRGMLTIGFFDNYCVLI